ncbi:Uncharacterized protein TCM_004368 [Theobroma cacao]|uniref:Uncharacterized protein n=1 Tax=Theobroma cacao TaxID=3641 RepID=A0A061DXN3_THECC|nr:Uncharacterized protein TCM_004368 [Theobroma cacao]
MKKSHLVCKSSTYTCLPNNCQQKNMKSKIQPLQTSTMLIQQKCRELSLESKVQLLTLIVQTAGFTIRAMNVGWLFGFVQANIGAQNMKKKHLCQQK